MLESFLFAPVAQSDQSSGFLNRRSQVQAQYEILECTLAGRGGETLNLVRLMTHRWFESSHPKYGWVAQLVRAAALSSIRRSGAA